MTEDAVLCLRSDADGIRFSWEANSLICLHSSVILFPSLSALCLFFFTRPLRNLLTKWPTVCLFVYFFLKPALVGLIRETHQRFLRMRAAFNAGGKKFVQCSSRFLFSKLKLALFKKKKNKHFRGFSYYVKYCFGSESVSWRKENLIN